MPSPLLVCASALVAFAAAVSAAPVIPPLGNVPITYAGYASIVQRLQALATAAPQLVRVWNAQDEYGVASPGSCYTADNGRAPCGHWFIALTNRTSMAEEGRVVQSRHVRDRPQVFLSGNLHGNEIVGPTTLITLAESLVHWYQHGGLDGAGNAWVRRLLDTRVLVMLPVTNPLGYDTRPEPVREENGVDPNRDFPYNVAPSACMVTTAARAVNEAWRAHLFQMSITFHGGMQAVAYEWGSGNHRGHSSESPDDAAQAAIAGVMREAAGAFRGEKYPVGRLNNLVYYVNGGMEDWAYAGSWDSSVVHACTPYSYGGYPAERTRYGDATLRAFNVLVEASDDKMPAIGSLGHGPTDSLLSVSGSGDGHIPRNLRLALSSFDLVSPYVQATLLVTTPRIGLADRRRQRRRLAGAAQPLLQQRQHARSLVEGQDAAAFASGAATFAPVTDGATKAAAVLVHPAAAGKPVTRAAWPATAESAAAAEGRAAVPTPRGLCGDAATAEQLAAWRPGPASDAVTPAAGTASAPAAAVAASAPEPRTLQPAAGGAASGDYAGPSACVPGSAAGGGAAATAGACTRYASQYTQWVTTPVTSDRAQGAGAGVYVGWDVGGAVRADATSMLVGSWDARVPPSMLFTAEPADTSAGGPEPVPSAAVLAALTGEYGLGADEARAFALYLHAWQQVADGRACR
jgi:hypothetical protein